MVKNSDVITMGYHMNFKKLPDCLSLDSRQFNNLDLFTPVVSKSTPTVADASPLIPCSIYRDNVVILHCTLVLILLLAMGSYILWKQTPVVSYKSSVCSTGTVFLALCSILTFIPPFLIAYRSNGFWLKVATYQEQPDIHFKHNVIAIVDSTSPDSYLVWSTYPTLNEMVGGNYRSPIVSSYEEDANEDGKKDHLYFDLEFPLSDNEKVHAVKLLMGFDFNLYTMTRLKMDCLVYVTSSSAIASNQLTIIGDIKLHQRKPLRHKGTHDQYNHDIIPADGTEPEDYDVGFILEKYSQRNLTTHLDNHYFVWTPNGSSASSFHLRVRLHYQTQTLEYTPGVWQVLKMAWVQYLAILVVFAAMFCRVKEYVFTNQIVPTWATVRAAAGRHL